jgi:serine O-acetyltransferase
VVDGLTTVGPDVVLRPFVTIGLRDGDPVGPTLGARVRVGTGAKVFGPVKVGDDVRIGANAVVLRDLPAGSVAVGVPAQVRDG